MGLVINKDKVEPENCLTFNFYVYEKDLPQGVYREQCYWYYAPLNFSVEDYRAARIQTAIKNNFRDYGFMEEYVIKYVDGIMVYNISVAEHFLDNNTSEDRFFHVYEVVSTIKGRKTMFITFINDKYENDEQRKDLMIRSFKYSGGIPTPYLPEDNYTIEEWINAEKIEFILRPRRNEVNSQKFMK